MEQTINSLKDERAYNLKQAALLLMPYTQMHAGLFPLCTFESQLIKFKEEFGEYNEAETEEKALKELGDCLIVITGIMRFAPLIGVCLADEIFGLAYELGKTPTDMMVYVERKFAINLGRTWRFDEETRTYKHVGVDGNE